MTDPDPDLLLSSGTPLSALLSSLRRSTLTLPNRLASIHADALFVQQAAHSPSLQRVLPDGTPAPRPLVANERCGTWYVPPASRHASAYFKSTDGHERAWKFSTRRLNMHLVAMIEEHDGIIIVDSTRRGKRMPDALSTTIPIWCTVLNTVLLPAHPLSSHLFLPPHLLPTTHAQVAALIPAFVESLRALNLNPSSLPVLTKPLRPLWITQESALLPASSSDGSHDDAENMASPPPNGILFTDYHPVICLTASRRVSASELDPHTNTFRYIQGAADDAENWARGLTPSLFWDNADVLLSTPEADMPELIASLLERDKIQRQTLAPIPPPRTTIRLTPYIGVCALPQEQHDATTDETCLVALTETPTPRETWIQSPNRMAVGLGKHKAASRNLRLALPDICAFACRLLQRQRDRGHEDPRGLVIACPSGRDTSVGAALALSCYLFDGNGRFRPPDADTAATHKLTVTKTQVKAKLGSIMTAYPAANPSRQTLQSVNSFLMDWTR